MTEGINTIVYPVRDIAQAKKLYSKFLGVEPSLDEPYYVGFNAGGQDIGLDPHGHNQGITGPISYCDVSDINNPAVLHQGSTAPIPLWFITVIVVLVNNADDRERARRVGDE